MESCLETRKLGFLDNTNLSWCPRLGDIQVDFDKSSYVPGERRQRVYCCTPCLRRWANGNSRPSLQRGILATGATLRLIKTSFPVFLPHRNPTSTQCIYLYILTLGPLVKIAWPIFVAVTDHPTKRGLFCHNSLAFHHHPWSTVGVSFICADFRLSHPF